MTRGAWSERGRGGWHQHLPFVVIVFVLSRGLVFTAMAMSPGLVPRATYSIAVDVEDPIMRPFIRWDSVWYMSIAQEGYRYNGNPKQEQNIGFFPLYPITVRACHVATHLSVPWCGVLLSNVAFLVSLVVLHGLIAWELSVAVARRAVTLLAVFPGSLFFSLMYTESFFLLFSVLAIWCWRRHRLIHGSLWAALASATRAPGLLLLVPLLVEGLGALKEARIRSKLVLACLLSVSGAAVFSLYQWLAFEDLLAFAHVQQQASGWQRRFAWPMGGPDLWWGLRQIVKPGLFPFPSAPVETWLLAPFPVDALMTLLFVVVAVWLLPRLPASYPLYMLAAVALPLFTVPGVWSMTRYLSVLFPAFMALGMIADRSRWLPWILISVFAIVLVCFSLRFAQWHWVG